MTPHVEISRLVRDFLEAYGFIILFYFLWSTLTICGTLLMIQMEIVEYSSVLHDWIGPVFSLLCSCVSYLKLQSQSTIDPVKIIILFCEMFWSFSLIFIFCDFGERVSSGFGEINDAISAFDWHLFPIGAQRMLPTILIVTQQPVALRGFGNVSFLREVFANVSHRSHSFESQMPNNNQILFSGSQWRIFILYGASWISELRSIFPGGTVQQKSKWYAHTYHLCGSES